MYAMPSAPQNNSIEAAFHQNLARGFAGADRLMPGFTANLYPQGTRGYMRNPYDNPFNEQSHYNARHYDDRHGFYQPRMNPAFVHPAVGRFGAPGSAPFAIPGPGTFAPPAPGRFAVPNPCGGGPISNCGGPRMNPCGGSSTPWIPMGNPCGGGMPMPMMNPGFTPPMPGTWAPAMAGPFAPPGASGFAPPMAGSFSPPPSGAFVVPNPAASRSVEFDVRVSGTVRRASEFERMIGLPQGGPSVPMPTPLANPQESCPPGTRWRSYGPGFGGQCVPLQFSSAQPFGTPQTLRGLAAARNPSGLPFRTVAAPFGFPVNGNGNGFQSASQGPTGAWAGNNNAAGRMLAARGGYTNKYDAGPMPNNSRPAGTRRAWAGLQSPRRLTGQTARNPGGACCDSCAQGKACTGCGSHDHGSAARNPCGCGANNHAA